MSNTSNPRYPDAYEQDCTYDQTCEVHNASERAHPAHDLPRNTQGHEAWNRYRRRPQR